MTKCLIELNKNFKNMEEVNKNTEIDNSDFFGLRRTELKLKK